ncbi:unnamed protein product [Prunus armeniaca]|uniref:Uncharacterized protein n=1 Tax=Prunus armeniaca TaxID=36596 RepID=A0A6J5X1S1_PRUAR|nr:unnamed protein product [Prunus armeniaca]
MSNETGGESAVPAGAFREFLKPNSGVQLSFKRQGLTSFSNDTENMPLERNVVVFETLDGDGDSSREAGPSLPSDVCMESKGE